MPKDVNHFVRAFKNSMKGIRACYEMETAFRQEVWIGSIMFPFSFLVAQTVVEWLLLIGSMLLVLSTELMNTAIENTLDKTVPEFSRRAGIAKDQGSAAVFFTLFICGLVWAGLIFQNWQQLLDLAGKYF